MPRAGIGACSKALERLGYDVEILDAVEIDKYAIKSFNAIHGTNFEVQDITNWDKYYENVDIITHGSPCQDFSVAGKQAGGDRGSGTRSSLMYETIRIVGKIRPKYVLWENVKNLLSKKHRHNFDAYIETMKNLGYNSYYEVLNAKDYGIPQNRERVFTVSIREDIDKGYEFPEKEELKIRLKDILEEEVEEKYYLDDEIARKIEFNHSEKSNIIGNLVMDKWQESMKRIYDINKYSPAINTMQGGNLEPKIIERAPLKFLNRNQKNIEGDYAFCVDSCNTGGIKEIIIGSTQKHAAVSTDGIVPTLTSAMGQGGGHVPMHNYQIKIRKLTPRECWRLMGFDDEDFEKARDVPMSNTQLYKQAGNSIVVNVLERIFKKLWGEK